jgi:hypothetical protein
MRSGERANGLNDLFFECAGDSLSVEAQASRLQAEDASRDGRSYRMRSALIPRRRSAGRPRSWRLLSFLARSAERYAHDTSERASCVQSIIL